ncbi:MAG: hypothetical protein ABFS35_23695 [Bacteroidota bacterium]
MRAFFVVISIFFIGVIVYLNIKLYFGPDLNNKKETCRDVLCQLNYIEGEIKNNNLAYEMQSIFPEGYVFTYALYGLSWCELAMAEKNNPVLFDHAISEARYAYNQINTGFARSNFDSTLIPTYGIFYAGWKNYLLSKILACTNEKDKNVIDEFTFQCDQIASAFERSKTPYLESYLNSSWPADAFLAIASLKIHDEIISDKYSSIIKNWIKNLKSKLDPETKLIPHSTHSETGKTIEGARGSSISLILRLLTEIDPEFAVEQFKIYHEKFHITRFGLPAISEYPEGEAGLGDVDSGPVILGVGFAGTIVAIGTLKSFGEYGTANLLSNTIEAFGFSYTSDKKKRFVLGLLPIADLFISWSRISSANSEVIAIKGVNSYSLGSRLLFHVYSLLVIVFILLILYRKSLLELIKNKLKVRL